MNTLNQPPEKTAVKWCFLSALVIIVDQLSKYLVVHHLTPYEPYPVLPLFNLTLMHNKGAAFSFLSNTGSLSTWLFSAIAVAVSIVLLIWLKRTPAQKRWQGCALALVLGGALGNLLDRFSPGYVIDFLDFYYQNHHFAAFNLADSAITVGAVMLLIEAFIFRK